MCQVCHRQTEQVCSDVTVPNGSCNVVYEEKCNVEYQTEIVERCQDKLIYYNLI